MKYVFFCHWLALCRCCRLAADSLYDVREQFELSLWRARENARLDSFRCNVRVD